MFDFRLRSPFDLELDNEVLGVRCLDKVNLSEANRASGE